MNKLQVEFNEELYLEDGTVLTQIPQYSSYYADIENGQIYSVRTGNKIKHIPSHERPLPHNYVTTTLVNDNGVSRNLGVHEFCVAAREGTWDWKDDGLEINHIDEVKNNNREENLEILLHIDQYTDTVRHKMRLKKQGVSHWNSILSEDEVIEIRQRYSVFEHGLKIDFVEDLANEYGVSVSCINNIIYNHSWTHLGGYDEQE